MNQNEASDVQLIEEICSNSPKTSACFKVLVNRYQRDLYWLIRRYTKNHEDTNDLIQQVWIKVWKNLASFKQDAAFFTWLYRIAKNETLNFLAKEKRTKTIELDNTLITILPGNSQLQQHSPEHIEHLLLQAIDSLPEKQAMVFQLKYFEEMKYSDMAKMLNQSEGGLKANYFHAVQKIEEFLTNQLNLLT
jgi:RNA polymerase sigma-70 factor, ECF subfamily